MFKYIQEQQAQIEQLKQQTAQRYKCSSCNKYFSDKQLKHKTYNSKIILNSISIYNLGNTLEQTKSTIARKFKTSVPITTIQSWIKEYSGICTFARLRKEAIQLYKPEEMIFSQKLQHNQVYNFQLHKAKLKLASKELTSQKFALLKAYLEKIPTQEFPHHIFQPKPDKPELNELARSSQLKFQTLNFIKKEKHARKQVSGTNFVGNQANQLAKLALNLTTTNKQRHETIQNFMLTNDSAAIAAEIPVYLTNDDIKYFKSRGFVINFEYHQTPITGHIDLLQIRNGLIHILDYKPDAHLKQVQEQAIQQLTIYALALASRTKLDLASFKCAFFDENNYFEFFPLHAVYERR